MRGGWREEEETKVAIVQSQAMSRGILGTSLVSRLQDRNEKSTRITVVIITDLNFPPTLTESK